jgi:hypothetical protein
MNHRYIRIVMTCLMVGTVMICLRKPAQKTAMPQTASVTLPQDGDEQSVLSNTIDNDNQATQQEKEQQPEETPKKAETKKEKRAAAIKAKQEARINNAQTRTQAAKKSKPKVSASTDSTQHAEEKAEPNVAETKCTTSACPITLKPNISSKDLSYKYGFFKYSPTSISLTINGKDIEINNYDPIIIEFDKSNILTACCKYKFIAGYEGVVVTTWKVKPGATYDVTFSWKTPEKILIDGDGIELLNTKNDAKSGRGHADQKEHGAQSTSSKDADEDNDEEDEEKEETPNRPTALSRHTGTKKTLKFLK